MASLAERLKELRNRRGKLVHDARAIHERAEADGQRGLTPEESQSWEKMLNEADRLSDEIRNLERQLDLERADADAHINDPTNQRAQTRDDGLEVIRADEYRSAFAAALTGSAAPQQQALLARASMLPAVRSLQAANGGAGGFLVAPEQFVNQLIQAVDDLVFVRQFSTVMPLVSAASLGAPMLASDVSDPEWTSELSTGSEDESLGFGKRALTPHPLAKRIKVSNQLLLATANGAETIVLQRLAAKFAAAQEKGFLSGSGVNQPLGVFTASADGIPAARDSSEDNTTTAVTADGLISAKYKLKQQYWGGARWVLHRDIAKQIAKLKDADGQYIWRLSMRDGEPDRLLDLPMHTSEYAPNTMTTGKYVAVLGDFQHYWIAEMQMLLIQRLVELYAEQNQTGFIGRAQADGAPVLPDAFVRVKLA